MHNHWFVSETRIRSQREENTYQYVLIYCSPILYYDIDPYSISAGAYKLE